MILNNNGVEWARKFVQMVNERKTIQTGINIKTFYSQHSKFGKKELRFEVQRHWTSRDRPGLQQGQDEKQPEDLRGFDLGSLKGQTQRALIRKTIWDNVSSRTIPCLHYILCTLHFTLKPIYPCELQPFRPHRNWLVNWSILIDSSSDCVRRTNIVLSKDIPILIHSFSNQNPSP